jgi:hypothetical protein
MNSTSSIWKEQKGTIKIELLRNELYAVKIDGLIVYTGTRDRCQTYAVSLAPLNDREKQDQYLEQAIRMSQ